MKAHELAKKLLEGPDVEVTVRGYEGGVNIITTVNEPKELALNVHPNEWYYGYHEYCDYDNYEGKEKIQAVHLD